jgi:asparagine synthase (glutamine-hydrolysing)
MCGICGQFNFRSGAPVDLSAVKAMADTMIHRGPDDEGYHSSGPLGLGFRRLSIIDLASGHQPMCDPDGKVWIVFNGEIYNFKEIRAELQAKGYVFRTESDTEVIVLGYLQWGEDVLTHLNGMFGLAIWDERKRKLLVARDRMGIKLIYYRECGGGIQFGSEMRPLMISPDFAREVDPVALNLFLRYRFAPSPFTIMRGIRKLPPGWKLVVENGVMRTERWWDYRPVPFAPGLRAEEAVEELDLLYAGAMKRHMIADVPVGLFLSGGVDSTLLLALMNMNGGKWKTFTVGYGKDFADDELALAARTAADMGAENIPLLLDRGTFEAALPQIVRSLEEPIASSSIVPMYFLSQLARREVKVAHVGQGPDELFGGYRRHLGLSLGSRWRSIPGPVRRGLALASRPFARNESLRRGLSSLGEPSRMKRYQQVLSLLPGESIDRLFIPGILPDGAGDALLDCWRDLEPAVRDADELGGFQYIEMRSTLPDELLMYADKLSMAHSLEVRVPYLDVEIVEFVERLPPGLKIRGLRQKWVHKQVCARHIPADVLGRKKRGFAVNVVDGWFRESITSRLTARMRDPGSEVYRFLSFKEVGALLDEHRRGARDNHKILFSVALFDQWLESALRT